MALWKRWKEGAKISENDFDKLLAQRANQLKKEHGIQYTPTEVIPQDAGMAREIFDAGVDLLIEVGAYCRDTSTVIKFSEDEVLNAIRECRSVVFLGSGGDVVVYRSRGVEDGKRPLICGGPCGCPVSEDLYLDVLTSYAMEGVDAVVSGSLTSYRGMAVEKGSPIEIAAVMHEVDLTRSAIVRANRAGLCIVGPMSGITATALNAALVRGDMRATDLFNIALLNELKLDLNLLNRLYLLQQNGALVEIGQCPIIGYIGGPEETAIISVAEILLDYLLGATCTSTSPVSMHSVSTDRKALWVAAATLLAVKRSFSPLVDSWIWAGAGPCTEMLCYEIAAHTIVHTVCGVDMIFSAGCTKGTCTDHYTGMEARIAREVANAAAKMSIKEATDVVNELLKRYEDDILKRRAPLGKSFKECYSIREASPSHEYLKVWENVKKSLKELDSKFDFNDLS